MLQPSFHIESTNVQTEDFRPCRLMIVLDSDSLHYTVVNTETKQVLCIKYFHLREAGDRDREELIREIIYGDELLSREVNETFLIYAFAASELIPEIYFDRNMIEDSISLVYGNAEKGIVYHEKIPWWDIYNVYRVPPAIDKLLQYKFPAAKYLHYYSILLESFKKLTAHEFPEFVQTIFFEERMIVAVYKKNQPQLLQSFSYSNQIDVAYHLLNCCKQLELNQQQLQLQISGFVEKKSSVYHEVAKYFQHISFDEPGENIMMTDELQKYPLSYFSTLLKLAVCA